MKTICSELFRHTESLSQHTSLPKAETQTVAHVIVTTTQYGQRHIHVSTIDQHAHIVTKS